MATDTATLRSRVDVFTSANVVGLTVREARCDYAKALNIPEGATPSIDGEVVDESHVIEAGETVRFSLATGEKG